MLYKTSISTDGLVGSVIHIALLWKKEVCCYSHPLITFFDKLTVIQWLREPETWSTWQQTQPKMQQQSTILFVLLSVFLVLVSFTSLLFCIFVGSLYLLCSEATPLKGIMLKKQFDILGNTHVRFLAESWMGRLMPLVWKKLAWLCSTSSSTSKAH